MADSEAFNERSPAARGGNGGISLIDFRSGSPVINYDILPGIRLPPNRTAPRRRRASLYQDEQQDLREVHGMVKELNSRRDEAIVLYTLLTVELSVALRDGDENKKEHITHNVIPLLLVYMEDIDARLVVCAEAELDITALRPEDRPMLTYRRHQYRTIASMDDEDARDWTRLSKSQLEDLLTHLRLRDQTFTVGRQGHTSRVTGEEMLLISLTRFCTGDSWKDMVRLRFGGGITRCHEMFDVFIYFTFTTFFHKISGNSMIQWIPCIDYCRRKMYDKAITNSARCPITAWRRETDQLDRLVNIEERDLPFDLWMAYGSIDCTDWQTCRIGAGPVGPWEGASRRVDAYQLQRAFYSGYFRAHGLKYQTVLLPSGMWGSVWGASMAHNDNGILNQSGLVPYLEDILTTNEDGYYPTLIGDAIYPQDRTVLWTTKVPRGASDNFYSFKRACSTVRQPHEIHYGSFFNYFHLFKNETQTRLFNNCEKAYRTGVVGFFLHNCFTCIKGSGVNSFFDSRHPTLQQYLPLDEVIPPYVPFALNAHYRYR